MSAESLTRRAFLRTSALAATAAGLVACGGATPAEPAAPEATTAPAAETTAPEAAAAPAEAVSRYQESPMLAEMVAAGDLPPVEERLPRNPMVLEPLGTIGTHGGTWFRVDTGPNAINSRAGAESFLAYDTDGVGMHLDVAERYEVSDDGNEFTFYLREGMRWSDGEPFTADDIMFYYDDVLMNEDLTPSFPKWLMPGDEGVVFEKIDDYTVKIKFAVPYGIFLDRVCFSGPTFMNYPKHYLQKFHPSYADADELAALVKDRGFEEWFQLFGSEINFQRNPDLPTIHPWKINSADWTTTASADRNPYYFKVDPEGNQLPYIDTVTYFIVETAEMIPMRIVTGEVNHQAWSTGISNYTLYMENREKGDYDVFIWNYGSSATAMNVNQTKMVSEGDTVAAELRDLLRNREFRLALSRSIDRDDLNELIFLGLSTPPIELFPDVVKDDPEMQAIFELDVEEGNRILDELGLTDRDGDGMRLLPSGARLDLIMVGHMAYAIHRDVAEVCTQYFREIGIRATMDWITGEVWWPRIQDGDFDIVAYETDYTSPNAFWLTYPRSFFPVETSTYWAPRWGTYYATGGREGDEPDHPDAQRLIDLYDQVLVTPDADDRKALTDEAFTICAKNLWPIHTLAVRPEPCIVKHGFKNVPEYGLMAYPVWGEKTTFPEQYYIEPA